MTVVLAGKGVVGDQGHVCYAPPVVSYPAHFATATVHKSQTRTRETGSSKQAVNKQSTSAASLATYIRAPRLRSTELTTQRPREIMHKTHAQAVKLTRMRNLVYFLLHLPAGILSTLMWSLVAEDAY